MGKKKINNNFAKAYSGIEDECQEKFGVSAGGINEYVRRLESARFAPNRDDVLGKLSAYQHISRRLDNEPNAMRHVKELSKDDVQWVKKFGNSLKKQKDPISRYLKSARKYARSRKMRRILFILLFLLADVAGAIALWYFGIFK